MICAGSNSNSGQARHSSCTSYTTILAKARSMNKRKKMPGLLAEECLAVRGEECPACMPFTDELSEAGAFSLLHLLFPAVHIHVHTHTHPESLLPALNALVLPGACFQAGEMSYRQEGKPCQAGAASSHRLQSPGSGPYLLVSKRGK